MDHAHIKHWPEPELVGSPSIGIYPSKRAEGQISSSRQVRHIGLSQKCEAAAQRRAPTPIDVVIVGGELMFLALGPIGVPELVAKLVLEVKVWVKVDGITAGGGAEETGLAGRDDNDDANFDLASRYFV